MISAVSTKMTYDLFVSLNADKRERIMKISYQWLAALVDLDGVKPEEVAHALNRSGIEVESIVPLVQATKITTGLVKEKKAIPGSDHLSSVIVDTGQHGVRTIVCGAGNIATGQKVLVALPGAVLPKVTIQESVIKGHPSQGMVCALNELGLDPKFLSKAQLEGIEVLDPSTPVGQDTILEDLGLNDTIIDIKVLANRSDLLAMEFVAREVGALLHRKMLPSPELTLPAYTTSTFVSTIETKKVIDFSVQVLKGIQSIQTPQWIKHRLIASGIRPLSFLVDIGNYMMLLTGQPIHFYDLRKLPKPELIIADHNPTSFVALDDKNYQLNDQDIVISSKQDVMCLAGIMGAKICAVDDTTQDVVIEVARFDAATIRKTALRLNLMSDASIRFAKGIRASSPAKILSMVVSLILNLTTIREIEEPKFNNTQEEKPRTIDWTAKQINRILSTDFTDQEISEVFYRFNMVTHKTPLGFKTTIPFYRQDIEGVADLAEEVIRVLGFDSVKMSAMPITIQVGGFDEKQDKIQRIKQFLSSQGMDEVLTYTLVDETLMSEGNLIEDGTGLMLKNPLSEERKHVRKNLISSLLSTVEYNISRQGIGGKIFEISQVFTQEHSSIELGGVLFGEITKRSAINPETFSFFDLKGIVESLLHHLHIEPTRYRWNQGDKVPNLLHPGRWAQLIIQQEVIAVIGQLNPTIQLQRNLGKQPILVLQMNLDKLLAIKTSSLKFQPISRFPAVKRDLAFYVAASTPFAEIVKTVKKAGKKLVDQVELFDLYQGSNVPEGQVSMAIRISLVNDQKTLQEEQINHTMDAIKNALIEDWQMNLRS